MDKELELQIKIFMAQELEKGTSLSDIQNMINEKFSQHMTYMDVRIMASMLDVDWRSLDPNAKAAEATPDDVADEANPANDTVPEENGEVPGEDAAPRESVENNTVVEVSPIARPGMMFSGTVKFASGSTAEWYVDNMGRLGLENLVGEKPDKNDVELFQVELDKALRKMMGR